MCHPDRNEVEWRDLDASGSYKVRTEGKCVDPSTTLRCAQDDIRGEFVVFPNNSTIDWYHGENKNPNARMGIWIFGARVLIGLFEKSCHTNTFLISVLQISLFLLHIAD